MDRTICAKESSPVRGCLTSGSGRSFNRSGSSRPERFRSMIGDRKEPGAHERLGRRLVGLGTRRPVPREGRTCETDPNVREFPVRTCTSATAHVVVRIVVAPRPPGRLCRAGNGGRGIWEGWDVHAIPPSPGSLRVHPSVLCISPLQEGQRRAGTARFPRLVGLGLGPRKNPATPLGRRCPSILLVSRVGETQSRASEVALELGDASGSTDREGCVLAAPAKDQMLDQSMSVMLSSIS